MKVLFICEGNVIRSQMAAALYNHKTGRSDAVSAGFVAAHGEQPAAETIDVLKEIGIDVSESKAVRFTPEMLEGVDRIIVFPTSYLPDWVMKDPRTKLWKVIDPYYHTTSDIGLFRKIRDYISKKVDKLIEEEQINHED